MTEFSFVILLLSFDVAAAGLPFSCTLPFDVPSPLLLQGIALTFGGRAETAQHIVEQACFYSGGCTCR